MRGKRPQPRPGPQEEVVLFTVGGFRFAIAAGVVNEIRGMDGLEPFTFGGIVSRVTKLKYTLERNGTTYFVVDGARHFQLPPSRPSRVLILRNSPVGVLVDSTDRMMSISALHPLPHAFAHEERAWYRGLAVVSGEVIPVVNHAAFLSKAEQETLREGLNRLQGVAAL